MHRASRDLLEHHGYRVLYRSDGWTECLAVRDDERWLGRGSDEDEALADVLRQMLPSHLARVLLLPIAAEENIAPGLPEHPISPASDDAGATASAPADARDDGEDQLARAEPIAESPPPVPAQPTAAAPPQRARPRIDEREAVHRLEALRSCIEDARLVVARMAPDLQRLYMSAWMARARAIQEIHGDSERVRRGTGAIASELASMAGAWWPGTVSVLRIDTVPSDVAREMHTDDTPADWEEAADLVEHLIERELESLPDRGLDLDGWADADSLAPAPNDVPTLFGGARSWLEAVSGPLGGPPHRVSDRSIEPADLRAHAAILRWLRGWEEDTEAWASTLGRLRWLARKDAYVADIAAQLLDARYRPAKPWPFVLGMDPGARRRRKERKRLLQTVPDTTTPEDAVTRWVEDALGLGAELPLERIASILGSVSGTVRAIDPETISPAMRRRFRKLARRLAGEAGGDGAEDVERSTLVDADDGADVDHVGVTIVDPASERLERRVRRRVEGKTALFVGNRSDPRLHTALEDRLGLRIEWCDGGPRRIAAACERISSGRYGIVLSATGFQSHKDDYLLSRAARAAGASYVRVDRGRPAACVRALSRELAIRAET